ncbi:MAG: yddE [Deltaproteobacteria bacterium]|nr:yddE [Deltaproteobacteria bacterium]
MKFFHVDSYTSRPFGGNPAGVCILTHPKVDSWMLNVAAEMNLSETAFIIRSANGYNLRWFTPKIEVELCGHGTLASAHIIWQEGLAREDEAILFQTKSGTLSCRRREASIAMDFPLLPEHQIDPPERLARSLGISPVYVGARGQDILVDVGSEEAVKEIRPDYSLMLELPIRGVIVTGRAGGQEFDFVSRFFAPRVGINEDPATGWAHCCLASYWSKRLMKNDLVARQVSERGGVIGMRIQGGRVELSGEAITVMKGEIVI